MNTEKEAMIAQSLVDEIFKEMYRQGVTCKGLARESSMSGSGLHQILVGDTRLRVDRYIWLCRRLGMDAGKTLLEVIEKHEGEER